MTDRYYDQHEHQGEARNASQGHGMQDREYNETASLLDRLADAERGEPDAGFESRLIAAAKPGVAGTIGPGAVSDREPELRGVLARTWWMLPVAAALAIGVVMSPTWRSPSAAPSATPGALSGTPMAAGTGSEGQPLVAMTLASVEADLDDFLFIDELADTQSVFASGDEFSNGGVDETADSLLYDFLAGDGDAL